MKLILKSVRVKNFFSVGAIPVDFTYTPGNHAVIGKVVGQDTSNGVGKSTIFTDAIIFAFKGISIRGLNKDQMINAINGSECEVCLSFTLDGVDYRIERGLNPNFLRFIHEDENETKETEEERASLREAQSDIDKALCVSTATLINMITLNINYSKPFLKLDAADRRQIFLDVMNTSIFGKMLDRARKDYNSAKQDLKVLSAELRAAEENLQTKLDTLKKINEYRAGFEESKVRRIESLLLSKNNHLEKTAQLEQSPILKTSFKDILSNLLAAKEKCQSFITEAETIISTNRRVIQTNKDKIARLKANPVCSECNSPTTEGHAQIHIKELEDKISVLISENTSKQTTADQIRVKLKDIRDKSTKCESRILEQNNINKEIENLNQKILQIDETIKSIENETFAMTSVVSDDDITKSKLRVEIKKQELAEKDKQLLYADIARDRLGDKGIKSFSIKKIVPVLNKKMNEYLALFKATYTISFDSELKETLKSRRRDEFSYNNFSAGEQKRIDLALMFSLLSIARSRSSVDCNVLVLDEILDTSLCADGTASLISFLKTDFRTLFPDLCVYIISHKSELSEDNFNTIIRLKKENNFTKIDEIQSCQPVVQV